MCKFIFLIALAFGSIEISQSVKVVFTMKLAQPNIDLNCGYKLNKKKKEKFTSLIVKKEGVQFFNFQQGTPTFTNVTGITDIEYKKGGRFAIKNYSKDTFGNYDCEIYYNGGKMLVNKLNFQVQSTCKPAWKSATVATLPNNAFIAAYDTNNKPVYVCRFQHNSGSGLIPGRVDTNTGVCIYTDNGVLNTTTFEVLLSASYLWAPHSDDTDVPIDTYQQDPSNTVYISRCNLQGTTIVGKMHFWKVDTNRMYFVSDGVEKSRSSGGCVNHEILTCHQ